MKRLQTFAPLLAVAMTAAGFSDLAERLDPCVDASVSVPGPSLPLPVINEIITR